MALTKSIGLMLDHTGIRYAKVKRKKSWELEGGGSLDFQSGWIVEDQLNATHEIGQTIKQWVRKEKLIGASVSLTVPTSQVIIRKLRIAASNPKELKQLVALEVETVLHLPFDNPVFDYMTIGMEDGHYEVLLFASPRTWIVPCIKLLEDAGLRVSVIELASTALARMIGEKINHSFENTLIINLDKSNIEVYMFHQGLPVFMRVMNEFEQQASDQDGLGPELIGSVNAEISRLLSFYQYSIHEGRSRITNAIVTGSLKGKERFVEEFRTIQPEIGVELVPFGSDHVSENADYEELSIPFGLAIRDKKTDSVNLLPEKAFTQRGWPKQFVAAAVIWLVCLIAIISIYSGSKGKLDRLEQEAVQIANTNTALESRLSHLNQQSSTEADPELAIAQIKENRQDVVAVMDRLHDELPSGAAIQTLEYSKPGEVSLIVKFLDMEHISQYLDSLRRMPFAGGALLQGFSGTDAEWTARMQLKWKGDSLETAEEEGGEENSDSKS